MEKLVVYVQSNPASITYYDFSENLKALKDYRQYKAVGFPDLYIGKVNLSTQEITDLTEKDVEHINDSEDSKAWNMYA